MKKSLIHRAGLAAILALGCAPAVHPARPRHYTRDNFMTFDQATVDSAGAFLVGELERLDQTLHMPLVSYTWSRDIDLRTDVSMGDETSSYTNSSFGAANGVSGSGKAWIGKEADAITGISLDIGKTANPLPLWGMQLGWTLPELASAQQLGRPVDVQKYEGMQLKYNMDVDEQVYIGDTAMGMTGLCNAALVTNVANATYGGWASGATVYEILQDVNELLTSVWAASGYAACPTELRLPPAQYAYLVGNIVSQAGNISILQYLVANNISTANNGTPLNIQPLKWLPTAGVSSATRMMAYTKRQQYVRFPLVPLQRTPMEYRSLRQITTYYGRLGQVETVYPETIGYRDGI